MPGHNFTAERLKGAKKMVWNFSSEIIPAVWLMLKKDSVFTFAYSSLYNEIG